MAKLNRFVVNQECRKSAARQQQHSHINDLIYRSILRAKTPAAEEPVAMIRTDGKRPDGIKFIPWARGKPFAWDVIFIDTFAESHISNTSVLAGEGVNKGAANKIAKYLNLKQLILFIPISIKATGTYNNLVVELIE